MLKKESFAALKRRALEFDHSSFEYLEYESAASYEPIAGSYSLILLSGVKPEAGIRELHWAANEPEGVIAAAKSGGVETLVTFVPEEWKTRFLEDGFSEFGILREYWIHDLCGPRMIKTTCRPILPDECAEAARITRECRFQSREFYGETKESAEAWLGGGEPNAAAVGLQHPAILACFDGGKMAGAAFTGIYGYEGTSGPIVWVRELAVRPAYQGRGYGRALLESVLQYGVDRGAKNAFLMADDCNSGAVQLYRSVGFEPSEDDVQIDLVYKP